MKVIGIDPAPQNETTIYDGVCWSTVQAHRLPKHVADLAERNDDLLICWDAPLSSGRMGVPGCYYIRPIEHFFCEAGRWKAPKGISVLAYAGCPHWTVSRAALGLPRVGQFDSVNLPWTYCAAGNAPTSKGRYVVEVHPAVAIWLWCRRTQNPPTTWEYKKDQDARETLWDIMGQIRGPLGPNRAPKNHDEFDAYVAYLLGSKWLASTGVALLGNANTGSFLVPDTPQLIQEFASYTTGSKPS